MTRPVLHPTRRRFLSLIGATALLPAQGRAATIDALDGSAFGTTWRIAAPVGSGLDRLRQDIGAMFAEIDRLMSPWRPDSTISRFNSQRAGDMPVAPALAEVTQAALDIAEKSRGAFDPTVGPLVAQWGFGPISGSPDPAWQALSAGTHHIAKTRDDTTLDLCGIAKGHALDRAIGHAAERGFTDLLMDLGGELRALGRHPSGRPWRVAVEHPLADVEPVGVIALADGLAVATSGLRSQSYVLGDRTYGHIIDPTRRAPARNSLVSVTVLAEDAMTADGWATALFAAGDAEGPKIARQLGIAALFLLRNGSDLHPVETGTMPEYLT